MSLGIEIINSSWDMSYIVEKAGIIEHGGWLLTENGFQFRYKTEDAELLQQVLADYATSYANEVVRPRMIIEIATMRWERSQRFTYDGVETWAQAALTDLSAAALDMMLDERAGLTPTPVPWKLSNTEWRLWGLEDLRLYGKAIRAHVQACFDREQELSNLIYAASDIDDLALIDITTGWPV